MDPGAFLGLSAAELAEVRRTSRRLFGGAQYRLEVGCAVAVEEIVTIKDLADQLGDPPGQKSVNTELKILEALGLLMRDRIGSDRRVYLRKQPSKYWSLCQEFAAKHGMPIPQEANA